MSVFRSPITIFAIGLLVLAALIIAPYLLASQQKNTIDFTANTSQTSTTSSEIAAIYSDGKAASSALVKTALFAGGCFWSTEHYLEDVPGVISVRSGYAGGTTQNPTYANHTSSGHREVIEVTFDANKITYAQLVESVTKHTDPTDAGGTFYDRGFEYAPVVYYDTAAEQKVAMEVLAKIDAMKVYAKPIATLVLPRPVFWPAEDYHQDYAKKNPVAYAAYNGASGRGTFIKKIWGANLDTFFTE